jgi:chromosome segregation ATPase
MDQIMHGIMERLQVAVKLCDIIASSVPQVSPAISGVRQRLELLLDADSSQLPVDKKQTSELREKVADIRHEIHQCSQALDSLKSPCAESYRSLLGAEKEHFESLDDSEQQRVNPPAYASKQAFHSISRLEDVFSLISADLMNLNGELEHRTLNNQKIPDVGHYEVQDNVPAPPSLSP